MLNVGAPTGADVTLLATELNEETPEPEAETERDAMPDGTDAELVGAAEREENEADTDVAEDAEADTAELRLKEVLAALDEATLEGAATTAVTSKRL